MTTTAEKIAVMQAFERGEKVEFKYPSGTVWFASDSPVWNWDACQYRVAPKPIDLVDVLEGIGHGMGITRYRGHAWTDIIARAKELQG